MYNNFCQIAKGLSDLFFGIYVIGVVLLAKNIMTEWLWMNEIFFPLKNTPI